MKTHRNVSLRSYDIFFLYKIKINFLLLSKLKVATFVSKVADTFHQSLVLMETPG